MPGLDSVLNSKMTLSSSTKSAEKTVSTLAQQAPHWVCLLIVVGGFLYYLDRIDERSATKAQKTDLVAVQRIESCHSIQDQSIKVMGELSATLKLQERSFHELSVTLDRIAERLPNK